MYYQAALLVLLCLVSGCATLARGTRQHVHLDAVPASAQIMVNDTNYSAPVDLKLDRNETYHVQVSAPGYRPVEFSLRAKWDGLSLSSMALPLGSVWTATDTVNGSDKAFAKLRKIELPPATRPSEPPLQLYEYVGFLLTEEQYQAALQKARDQAALNWQSP
jgi:hypothetical protein